MQTVFIAMSGGIDSSYSAYVLKKQGYNVVGFTFDLLPQSFRNECNRKMCCSAVSTNRARRVADHLSIPHYVINMRDEFQEHVIERFIAEYRAGRTPNPCILCNKYIKFASFLMKAAGMGAHLVATGHYAAIEKTPDGCRLKKGRDNAKDQSYFLYPIRRTDLSFVTFPLAECTKDLVRREFAMVEREPAKAEESQDICFIPGNDYRTFIRQFIPLRDGPIVDVDGKQIGKHEGVHLYTVGQRKGLNIPSTEPLYVIGINAEENAVVAGPKELLRHSSLVADDLNLLTKESRGRAKAKVRYRQKEQACFYSVEDDILEVVFDEPVSAITPGQSVVLYEGETVLGGGVIKARR